MLVFAKLAETTRHLLFTPKAFVQKSGTDFWGDFLITKHSEAYFRNIGYKIIITGIIYYGES